MVEPTLVRANAAVGRPVPRLAITLYGPPAVPFAVKVGAVATPLPSVLTITVVTPPGKVPLAPLEGAVNVTGMPLRLVPESFTFACSGVLKALLIAMLCGVPAVARIAYF